MSAIAFVAAITLAIVWKLRASGSERNHAQLVAVGVMSIASAVGLVVGIGLAIGGLFESQRTRTAALIGLVFNALGVLLFALLLVVGILAKR